MYVGFNLEAPVSGGDAGLPLRQAIACAIDRRDLVENVGDGVDIPQTGLVPPIFPGWQDQPPQTYDVGPRAPAVRAGGQPAAASWSAPDDRFAVAVGEWLRQACAAAGISVRGAAHGVGQVRGAVHARLHARHVSHRMDVRLPRAGQLPLRPVPQLASRRTAAAPTTRTRTSTACSRCRARPPMPAGTSTCCAAPPPRSPRTRPSSRCTSPRTTGSSARVSAASPPTRCTVWTCGSSG